MLTILVPLDDSCLARQALPVATDLVRAAHGWLVLLRVSSPREARERPQLKPEVMQELDALAKNLRSSQIPVETAVEHVDYEETGRAIVEAARRWRADLVVMATHGRGSLDRWLHGSVADAVLRQSDLPIVLASAAAAHVWPTDRAPRLLVPLDGSDFAKEALGPASALAEHLRAELHLLRVVEPPPYAQLVPESALATAHEELEAVAEGLREGGRSVEVAVALGSANTKIAALADEQAVDLIVMATHGRGGLSRLLLGSVATSTLRHASLPVMLIRPAALRGASPARSSRVREAEARQSSATPAWPVR